MCAAGGGRQQHSAALPGAQAGVQPSRSAHTASRAQRSASATRRGTPPQQPSPQTSADEASGSAEGQGQAALRSSRARRRVRAGAGLLRLRPRGGGTPSPAAETGAAPCTAGLSAKLLERMLHKRPCGGYDTRDWLPLLWRTCSHFEQCMAAQFQRLLGDIGALQGAPPRRGAAAVVEGVCADRTQGHRLWKAFPGAVPGAEARLAARRGMTWRSTGGHWRSPSDEPLRRSGRQDDETTLRLCDLAANEPALSNAH